MAHCWRVSVVLLVYLMGMHTMLVGSLPLTVWFNAMALYPSSCKKASILGKLESPAVQGMLRS